MQALIVGAWHQPMQGEAGRWFDGGLCRVNAVGGQLVMSIDNDLNAMPGIVRAIRLTEVTYDGKIWRFTADWQDGDVHVELWCSSLAVVQRS